MKKALSNLKDFFTDHFADVWIGFLLGLLLAIILSILQTSQPTRAEESGNLSFNRVDYSFSILSYGVWNEVYREERVFSDTSYVFDCDFSQIDQDDVNCRLRILYEIRRDESDDIFRPDLEYVFEDGFYFGIDDIDLMTNQMTLNLFSVQYGKYTPIAQNISFSDNGYPFFTLRFSPFIESEWICVEIYFNYHTVTNHLPVGRYQCYIETGFPVATYSNYYPSVTPPDFSDVENDAYNGLSALDQYLGGMPLKDVGLGKVLYSIMNNSHVLLTICIFLSIGILGFVLYGKR